MCDRTNARARRRIVSTMIFPMLLSVMITACGKEEAEAPPVVRAVKMVEFGSGSESQFRIYPGSIVAADATVLSFKVEGKILEIRVDAGTSVKKGDVLASLDPDDYEAAVNAEAAKTLAAEAEYLRYQQLYERNAVSLQDLEVKRRNHDVNKAALRTVQNALNDTVLRAPFTGRIAVKYAEEFQNVRPNDRIFVIQNDDDLEIKIDLPERDVLALGQSRNELISTPEAIGVFVEVSSVPGLRFPARIVSMSTLADPVTRTFEVKFAFETTDEIRLFPGMTARIFAERNVTADQPVDTKVLVSHAVFGDDSGDPSVWTVDPATMTVTKTHVVLGEFTGDSVEILGGLNAGDLVAITGIATLYEGAVVRRYENQ